MTSPQNQGPGPSRLEFRACREEDLRRLEWGGLHADHREIIEETFARQTAGEVLMLVALADDFPVAQAWLDFARAAEPGMALLWAVRTHPSMQGRGIGRDLVRHAEWIAAGRGYAVVELGVEKDNQGALRFYERLGYVPAGEVIETCRYRTPEGEEREWVVDQWKLRRRVVV